MESAFTDIYERKNSSKDKTEFEHGAVIKCCVCNQSLLHCFSPGNSLPTGSGTGIEEGRAKIKMK